MKKNIKTIIGCVLLLVIAFLYAHIAKTHNIYDKEIDTSQYLNTGVITETGITQTFTSEEEHLDAVRIKSVIFVDSKDTMFHYSLTEVDSKEVVAEGSISGEDVENSKFFEMKFDRITGTEGKKYELSVTAEGTESGMGVGFSYEQKEEKNTELQINGEAVDGTLILKTVTDRFDFETFAVFLVFAVYVIVFMKVLYKLFE